MDNKLTAPKAKELTHTHEIHGDQRNDPFYWLRERENKKVIDYLEAENEYTEKVLKPTEDFQKLLFEEMKGRIKEDDESVPYFLNDYWYITRFEKGAEYPIYSRKHLTLEADEEIIFNVNEMAEGYDYFQLAGMRISPNNQMSSFGTDTLSRRIYTIKIKDLRTGEILSDKLEGTTGSAVWAADNQTLFYTKKDPETLRAFQIYRHRLGDLQEKDELVFEEKDDTFNCYVGQSKSKKYLVISSSSTLTTEQRFLSNSDPFGTFKVFQPRTQGLEYFAAHYKESFYVYTNSDGATNFKLMQCPETYTEKENWQELIPHREDTFLEGIEIFKDYLVLEERKNGSLNIFIKPWDKQQTAYYLPFEEDVYTAYTGNNPEFDTSILRYGYTSLTTPSQVIDFDMKTREKEIKKEQIILDKTFDKGNYISEKIWVEVRDEKKVAISLVRKKSTLLSSETPLLLYGYGSYGHTVDPSFSSIRLSLLDRGFVFAIAHIRGGEYLGRPWYEDGKLLHKKNTFFDFIDCAKYLISNGYTSSKHLYAQGGSAGGLLMGAVMNMAPELFNGMISNVPFVDVVTTMSDESIPLTTGEYDEWGNPNHIEYYHYIKSYSPYDNLEDRLYPHLLVTTGLHDSQVQYWEPAKYVAKMRTFKNNLNQVLLKTEMTVGHGGASGRFESLNEVAMEWAFLLHLEGLA